MADKIRVSIIGGSGYTGGELIRLLSSHPQVEIVQIASRSKAGKFVHSVNPNLRKSVLLKYCAPEELTECDVMFLCLPHGEAMNSIHRYLDLSPKIIDLSADFRLNSPQEYSKWYGHQHASADLLEQFVYGVPELHRDKIAETNYVSCAGCNATAVILAVLPIMRAFDVDSIIAEVKVGSSEAGVQFSEGSHHPVRSGAVRSYKLVGHRHIGEMKQELEIDQICFSATSIDMVRGIVATCHVFTQQETPDEKELWKAYRQEYGNEPFMRIVKERSGIHRLPEPKHLSGTNFCDVGFERDPNGFRIVAVSALDNLMKGAAGQAVQNFNIMHGLPERTGLEFAGLFPV